MLDLLNEHCGELQKQAGSWVSNLCSNSIQVSVKIRPQNNKGQTGTGVGTRTGEERMKTRDAPRPLDPKQPVLYIEHCPVNTTYRRRALDLHASLADAIRTMQPQMQLQLRLNENNMPRVGAFEVSIAARPTDDHQARYELWTGITRVPVTAKVPHVDDIIAPACRALRLRHSQAGASQINLVRTSDRDINKILQKDKRRSI